MSPAGASSEQWHRDAIALPPQLVRAFGGRGAVSLRDHSVTGIQHLQFTPYEQRHFRFDLRLIELDSGLEISDDGDELWELFARVGVGHHPLALNTADLMVEGRALRGLILQDSHWEPNLLERTGTFHKYEDGRLLSFAVRCQVGCDPVRDAIRYRIEVRNRATTRLRLGVVPRARVTDPFDVGYPRRDAAQHPSWWQTVFDAGTDAQAWTAEARFRVTVEADLPAGDAHWRLELDPGESRVLHLALAIDDPAVGPAPQPGPTDRLAGEWAAAREAYRERRARTFAALPQLTCVDARTEKLYRACIATLVESTWRRDDFILDPFYSAGTWLFVLAWDVAFSAKALALADPGSVRRTLVELVRCGLAAHSYVGWNGSLGHHYSYSLVAGIRAVRDYIAVTGDEAILRAELGDGLTVGGRLAADLRATHDERLRADGLLGYGGNTRAFLENRTDGYQGATAAINLQLLDGARWLQEQGWPSLTATEVERIAGAAEALWDEDAAWYLTAPAPDRRELVSSYQIFELLWSEALSPERKAALAGHLVPGEFLGAHGMYSVARSDTEHWDRDDADWGGGGQYTGMPLRIAEALWRAGLDEPARQIWERCGSWTDAFPYLPQEIMTDSLTTPEVEQAAEIAAGAGVQAIVFGLCGIEPRPDGMLRIAPRRPGHELTLTGYRHRGVSFDVSLGADGWTVRWAGGVRSGDYRQELHIAAGSGAASVVPADQRPPSQ